MMKKIISFVLLTTIIIFLDVIGYILGILFIEDFTNIVI